MFSDECQNSKNMTTKALNIFFTMYNLKNIENYLSMCCLLHFKFLLEF